MAAAPRPRWRRRLAALLCGTAIALLVPELCMRWLVLSDAELARRAGARLRHAEWFASPLDDDFWKLACRFDHTVALSAAMPDPRLGWIRAGIAPGTHEHLDAAALGERTPVLLYGDSFAQGMLSGQQSFEGLLQSSPLGKTHALLNYGIGGYGADQVLLLARDTLPRYADRKPIAVVALLVDEDLERCLISFRSGPKPRLHLEGERLTEPEPVQTDAPRYLEQHPLGIASYLWRLVCFAPGVLPVRLQQVLQGEVVPLAEREALCSAIVRDTCRELRAHSQRSALMLMRARASVRDPRQAGWQEDLIRRVASAEDVPVLDTREVLLRALGGKLEHLDNLYYTGGAPVGHWNSQGNLAVFQLLRAFVEDRPTESALASVDQLLADGELAALDARTQVARAFGGELLVQYREEGDALCFVQSPRAPGSTEDGYLGLRAGNRGASSLRWSLPPGTQRLSAVLRAAGTPAEAAAQHELVVRVRQPHTDAAEQELRLPIGGAQLEWTTPIAGDALELVIDAPSGGGRSAWLLISRARRE